MSAITSERYNHFGKTSFLVKIILLKHFALEVWVSIVFSETTWPTEIKFHMITPYDWLAKIYTNCYGHMSKMATTTVYGKNSLNIFFSGTKSSLALGLGM